MGVLTIKTRTSVVQLVVRPDAFLREQATERGCDRNDTPSRLTLGDQEDVLN